MGILPLLLILMEMLWFFSSSRFSVWSFYHVEIYFLFPYSFQAFIMNGCCILQKANLMKWSNVIVMWFISLTLFMCWITFIDYIYRFMYVQPSLEHWTEANFIIVDNLFYMSLNFISKYLSTFMSMLICILQSLRISSLSIFMPISSVISLSLSLAFEPTPFFLYYKPTLKFNVFWISRSFPNYQWVKTPILSLLNTTK